MPFRSIACTSHYSKDNGKGAGVPRRVVPYARISFLEGGERGGWGCLISVFYSSHSLKGVGILLRLILGVWQVLRWSSGMVYGVSYLLRKFLLREDGGAMMVDVSFRDYGV